MYGIVNTCVINILFSCSERNRYIILLMFIYSFYKTFTCGMIMISSQYLRCFKWNDKQRRTVSLLWLTVHCTLWIHMYGSRKYNKTNLGCRTHKGNCTFCILIYIFNRSLFSGAPNLLVLFIQTYGKGKKTWIF